jgi:hypothetical protein
VAGGWTNAQLRRLLLDQIKKDEMNWMFSTHARHEKYKHIFAKKKLQVNTQRQTKGKIMQLPNFPTQKTLFSLKNVPKNHPAS